MDFSKCRCEADGFCSLYNKHMSADPPNWQWCKNATPEEREKYKFLSDKGVETHNTKKIQYTGKIVSTADLVNDAVRVMLPKICKEHKISAIAGVPRSGMIPAAAAAASLNVPLFSMSDGNIVVLNSFSINGGYRMQYHDPVVGKVLFIDDTVYTGSAAKNIKKKFPNILTAAVYVLPENKDAVDFYAKELEKPHILEWNFFNSQYMRDSLVDIDGVLNPNVPIEICLDEEKYINFLETVDPIVERIPQLFSVKALVTGRLDKYRGITEKWLERHNVKYQELIMFPTDQAERRNKDHARVVGEYKAETFKNLGGLFFVESELSEAKVIRRNCNFGTVVCPNNGIYF